MNKKLVIASILFSLVGLQACKKAPTVENLVNDPKLRAEITDICTSELKANTDEKNEHYEACTNLRHAMLECVLGKCKS